ncbi:hypothetical protein OIE13_15735 [Streptosporangium sp. NBC_01810]|uniref:hypothetical protein n=1 Tax=Streptosporangium sp. NBC_01810 TaxID=2975951 RepID=UPI002DDBFFC1|nr:hypothetical protein [Streptosporangium sp. NBC_01810]WSA29196.1 hypothetical protein OIE13_15735 [Streptosporangium sp. NBC_01810]
MWLPGADVLGGPRPPGRRADRPRHRLHGRPRLVAHLRETQIPLEVCPTSNVCTGQVARIEEHPLPRMIEEGLFVTLNSDDPPMFDTTLSGEYRVAAQHLGLDRQMLTTLARNAVQASSLDQAGKKKLLDEIATIADQPTATAP